MKRIVDIFLKNQRNHVLWTYVVELGGDGSRLNLENFKDEAITLAGIDGHGPIEELDALVHLEILK